MQNPLSPSSACTDLIKHFEGVRLHAYPDPASGGDPWTIGVGHTGPEVHAGLIWTEDQVDAALASDLRRFTIALRALIVSAPTSQGQFDAMIALMFNIGIGNFRKSSILANHLARRYFLAGEAFALWNRANGRVMAGFDDASGC